MDLNSGAIQFTSPPLAPPSARLLPDKKAIAVWGYTYDPASPAGSADKLEVDLFAIDSFAPVGRYVLEIAAPMVPMSVWPREPMESLSADGTRLAVLVTREQKPSIAIYELGSGKILTTFEVQFRGSTFPRIAWTQDGNALVLVETATGVVWVHDARDGKLLSTSRLFQAARVGGGEDVDTVPPFQIAVPVEKKLYAVSLLGGMAIRGLDDAQSAASEKFIGDLWQGQRSIGVPQIVADGAFLVIPFKTVGANDTEETSNLVVIDLSAPAKRRSVKAAVAVRDAVVTADGAAIVAVNASGELHILGARDGSVQRSFKLPGELQLIGVVTDAVSGAAPVKADVAAPAKPRGRGPLWIAIAAAGLLILGVAVAMLLRRRRGQA